MASSEDCSTPPMDTSAVEPVECLRAVPGLAPYVISHVHEAVLDRPVPEALLADLTADFQSGADFSEILRAIVGETGKVDPAEPSIKVVDFVEGGFAAILDRPVDPEAKAVYVGTIAASKLNCAGFLTELLGSEELRAALPRHRVLGSMVVSQVYEAVVGEPITDGRLAELVEQIQSGTSFAAVVQDMMRVSKTGFAFDGDLGPTTLTLALVGLSNAAPPTG